MRAAVALEEEVKVEDRIAVLESDVRHARADIAETKGDIKSIRTELHSFKTEVVQEFGKVRTEMANGFGELRTEMHKELGSIRTSIEQLRTYIEQAKLWMLVTGVGVILTTFVTIGHVLKLF